MSRLSPPDPRIAGLLKRFNIPEDETVTALDQLKKEIHEYGKRRCDVEASRDNLVYHMGAAFEANGALDLDSLALTGLLSLPAEAFASIFDDDEEVPERLIDCLRYAISRKDVLQWAHAKGTWLQWKRLQALYSHEVEAFRRSDAFGRPGWRSKNISSAQHYLIGEICRIAGLDRPSLVNRGQAFTFISEQGGNPRFWVEPALPSAWWEAEQ